MAQPPERPRKDERRNTPKSDSKEKRREDVLDIQCEVPCLSLLPLESRTLTCPAPQQQSPDPSSTSFPPPTAPQDIPSSLASTRPQAQSRSLFTQSSSSSATTPLSTLSEYFAFPSAEISGRAGPSSLQSPSTLRTIRASSLPVGDLFHMMADLSDLEVERPRPPSTTRIAEDILPALGGNSSPSRSDVPPRRASVQLDFRSTSPLTGGLHRLSPRIPTPPRESPAITVVDQPTWRNLFDSTGWIRLPPVPDHPLRPVTVQPIPHRRDLDSRDIDFGREMPYLPIPPSLRSIPVRPAARLSQSQPNVLRPSARPLAPPLELRSDARPNIREAQHVSPLSISGRRHSVAPPSSRSPQSNPVDPIAPDSRDQRSRTGRRREEDELMNIPTLRLRPLHEVAAVQTGLGETEIVEGHVVRRTPIIPSPTANRPARAFPPITVDTSTDTSSRAIQVGPPQRPAERPATLSPGFLSTWANLIPESIPHERLTHEPSTPSQTTHD